MDFLERQAKDVREMALYNFVHYIESKDHTQLLVEQVRETLTRLRPRTFGSEKGVRKGFGKGRSATVQYYTGFLSVQRRADKSAPLPVV